MILESKVELRRNDPPSSLKALRYSINASLSCPICSLSTALAYSCTAWSFFDIILGAGFTVLDAGVVRGATLDGPAAGASSGCVDLIDSVAVVVVAFDLSLSPA